MRVIENTIRCWADDADEKTLEQARHLAALPFRAGLVALMPDAHVGYGMPIGGVFAADGVIIPNAVGVDIGCGVAVQRTDALACNITRDMLVAAVGHIRKRVPVGFAHHPEDQVLDWAVGEGGISICSRELARARRQVGTLGGGNHFIEIRAGDDGYTYVMIHSGSRNVGKQVADHYNRVACDLNAKWYTSVPAEWYLAFLPADCDAGESYLYEMRRCVEFAALNRATMMRAVFDVLMDQWGTDSGHDFLDVPHNYAAEENGVWVHRKGATRARRGQLGIIPGSQGTASYIVRGLGSKLSYESCSHGAGRRMGRKAAVRDLDLATEQARLTDVVHAVRGVADLDEAPGAYKDIDVVMAAQTDLVEVVRKMKPLAVIKG